MITLIDKTKIFFYDYYDYFNVNIELNNEKSIDLKIYKDEFKNDDYIEDESKTWFCMLEEENQELIIQKLNEYLLKLI